MDKIKESAIVRGICAAVQSMAMPTFQDLTRILSLFGYRLTKNE